MKVPKIWILFSVGILSISIFTIFLVSFIILFCSKSSKSPDHRPIDDESYLFQEFDPSSNDITFGIVSLNEQLSNDDFLTYPSSNGKQVTISKFATSSRFECEGTCSCTSLTRRSSSNLISRPLFLIISAISSSLALRIAKESFHNQCYLQFSSNCDEKNIHTSVTSCTEKEDEEDEVAEYNCEGYCINKKVRSQSAQSAQVEYLKESGVCENLKTSGTVRMKRTISTTGTDKFFSKRTGKVSRRRHRYKHLYPLAQAKFTKVFLGPFCKEMSQKEFFYYYPNKKMRVKKKTPMCVGSGSYFPDERLDFHHQNVKCEMISGNLQGGVKKVAKNDQN